MTNIQKLRSKIKYYKYDSGICKRDGIYNPSTIGFLQSVFNNLKESAQKHANSTNLKEKITIDEQGNFIVFLYHKHIPVALYENVVEL